MSKISDVVGDAQLLPGEPIFVLRGRDILSTFAVSSYLNVVETFSPHTEHEEQVLDMLNAFRNWQQQHPEYVRLPD